MLLFYLDDDHVVVFNTFWGMPKIQERKGVQRNSTMGTLCQSFLYRIHNARGSVRKQGERIYMDVSSFFDMVCNLNFISGKGRRHVLLSGNVFISFHSARSSIGRGVVGLKRAAATHDDAAFSGELIDLTFAKNEPTFLSSSFKSNLMQPNFFFKIPSTSFALATTTTTTDEPLGKLQQQIWINIQPTICRISPARQSS